MLASSSRLREVRVVLFPSASSITFRATTALRTPFLQVAQVCVSCKVGRTKLRLRFARGTAVSRLPPLVRINV
jgi:hypothetical protein